MAGVAGVAGGERGGGVECADDTADRADVGCKYSLRAVKMGIKDSDTPSVLPLQRNNLFTLTATPLDRRVGRHCQPTIADGHHLPMPHVRPTAICLPYASAQTKLQMEQDS